MLWNTGSPEWEYVQVLYRDLDNVLAKLPGQVYHHLTPNSFKRHGKDAWRHVAIRVGHTMHELAKDSRGMIKSNSFSVCFEQGAWHEVEPKPGKEHSWKETNIQYHTHLDTQEIEQCVTAVIEHMIKHEGDYHARKANCHNFVQLLWVLLTAPNDRHVSRRCDYRRRCAQPSSSASASASLPIKALRSRVSSNKNTALPRIYHDRQESSRGAPPFVPGLPTAPWERDITADRIPDRNTNWTRRYPEDSISRGMQHAFDTGSVDVFVEEVGRQLGMPAGVDRPDTLDALDAEEERDAIAASIAQYTYMQEANDAAGDWASDAQAYSSELGNRASYPSHAPHDCSEDEGPSYTLTPPYGAYEEGHARRNSYTSSGSEDGYLTSPLPTPETISQQLYWEEESYAGIE